VHPHRHPCCTGGQLPPRAGETGARGKGRTAACCLLGSAACLPALPCCPRPPCTRPPLPAPLVRQAVAQSAMVEARQEQASMEEELSVLRHQVGAGYRPGGGAWRTATGSAGHRAPPAARWPRLLRASCSIRRCPRHPRRPCHPPPPPRASRHDPSCAWAPRLRWRRWAPRTARPSWRRSSTRSAARRSPGRSTSWRMRRRRVRGRGRCPAAAVPPACLPARVRVAGPAQARPRAWLGPGVRCPRGGGLLARSRRWPCAPLAARAAPGAIRGGRPRAEG
jgi:hypothetical protein